MAITRTKVAAPTAAHYLCVIVNFSEILSVTMVLFAVIDIIGSIPVVISLRNRVGHIQSEKATLAATVIMILFLFVGEGILKLFGVDVASFAVAGSLVLFFLALEMILGVRIYKEAEPESASIVPIAFPLIAGAGIRRGYVHGESDKTASAPKSDPVHPTELLATIYHAFGIDPETIVYNHLNQPRELVKAKAVTKLFA